jgi:ADP-ribose pyrophosphatase YjhB (NUDIX family)
VLDTEDRLLLMRYDWPDKSIWAPSGGGIEPGETAEQAIVRELARGDGSDGCPALAIRPDT